MQLDNANIFAILATAAVTIGNLLLSFISYRGQNKTEDRRIHIDEKRLDQEQSRSQTDATVQITSAATSLSGAYSSLLEMQKNEVLQLREVLNNLEREKDELELIRGRISDLANYARENVAARGAECADRVCAVQVETLTRMIFRLEERHVRLSE